MGFMELFFSVLELDLSDNNIKHIEGLYNLKKLRRLDLNKNEITSI
jgi:Leucine-rich repeat (LRR) protein